MGAIAILGDPWVDLVPYATTGPAKRTHALAQSVNGIGYATFRRLTRKPHGWGLATPGSSIDGIRFVNGMGFAPGAAGGAIRIFNTPLTIRDCVFENNTSIADGGAIFGFSNGPRIVRCVDRNNSAAFGGGAASLGKNAIVRDCQFFFNQAGRDGGAVNIANQSPVSPVFSQQCFIGNTASRDGGAVTLTGADLHQCLFAGN